MLHTIWYPIERLMAWRYARLTVPLIAGGVIAAALYALRMSRAVADEGLTALAPAILGVVEAAIGWAAVWTWRRIWRDPTPDEGQWGQLVYRHGVKRFGGMLTLVMPPLNALSTAWGDLSQGKSAATVTLLLTMWVGFFGWLSIGPWAGYWWGRFMARAAGVKPPPKQ